MEHIIAVIAVIGPPAVGKTTLTMRLGENHGCSVFRLREHVPKVMLAAAAANSDRVDWVDDVTVARALLAYAERVSGDESVHTVLLDNFPGSGTQVGLLLGILARLAPECAVTAAELVADDRVRLARVRARRVCHTCERDPVHDPRLPAQAVLGDPRRCARCGGTLHPAGATPRACSLPGQPALPRRPPVFGRRSPKPASMSCASTPAERSPTLPLNCPSSFQPGACPLDHR
jgi:adenylate kinase